MLSRHFFRLNSLKQLSKIVSTSSVRNSSDRPEVQQSPKLTDIGTRKIFSEEHDIFRQSVRRFFEEEVLPYHSEWEKNGQVSREVWKKAGENGLLGLGVNTPAEIGGIGGDVCLQLLHGKNSPGFNLHSDIVMPYISHYGTKEQIEKFIPAMTAGKCIGAIAMSEPGAGSDIQGIRTNAKQDGDDWILNGSKVFISNGYMSDLVLVVAITNPQAKSAAHGISLFLVEEGMKGFIKGRKLHKIGMKAQTIQHKLAELKTSIAVSRAFVDRCLQVHNEKGLDSESASMANTDLQNRVATECLQMHGGWGYMWEYPIARAFVDARVQPIYGGSNEIMKALIARNVVSDK